MNTMSTISNDFYKYSIYFATYAIVLSATVIYFENTEMNKSFSYSTLGFVLFSIISIAISSVYFSPMIKDKSSNMTIAYIAAGLITFASTISAIFAFSTPKQIEEIGYAFLGLTIITVVVLLALFFYIFGSYLQQKRGVVGFIIKFFFFIPCMLLDLIEYFKNEYKLTTRTEWIIIGIEIITLILYFAINPIINKAVNNNINYILHNPVFLNKQTVALYDTSSLAITKPDNTKLISNNFSISMWVYLNVQTSSFMNADGSSYEVNIFNYGNGKPKITYTNNFVDNTYRDIYSFYFTNAASKPNFQITLPNQKWNNIVFNYHGNVVDLFINGNLETSFTFDSINQQYSTMPEYSIKDSITVGQNGGLKGAICNITYNNTNLEKHQIVSNYNLLMLKNPPILL